MPNRVVSGDAISRSDKLLKIEPVGYRAEYSYLLTLALANGSFECEPRKLWTNLYAYNRPDFTPERVAEMLDKYERAKMLYRWSDADGKLWGHWVGQLKPGRLPGAARIKQGEKVGAAIPLQDMEVWLAAKGPLQPVYSALGNRIQAVTEPYTDSNHGFGFCSGKGEGVGGGVAPVRAEQFIQENVSELPASPAYLTSLSESNSNSKSEEPAQPAPVTQDIVPAKPTAKPGPVPVPAKAKAPATSPGYVPAYRSVQPAVSTQATARALAPAPKDEPWNILNFAFERIEDWEGLTPKELQRVVFYHMRVDKKKYWAARVNSLEDLKRCLPTMASDSQVPKDFRVSGEVTLVIGRTADPACPLCEGQGFTIGRNEAYTGVDFAQANWCPCAKEDKRPWLSWKPTRNDE
jgi:hypothetical protein